MNNKKNYGKINWLKQNIEFSSLTGNKENMFQYCKNNTDEHEDMKYKVFKELVTKGYSVFTEVEFLSGGRADIVCFDDKGNGWIFEIVHTESQESISSKMNKYPIDFDLEVIYTNKPVELPI